MFGVFTALPGQLVCTRSNTMAETFSMTNINATCLGTLFAALSLSLSLSCAWLSHFYPNIILLNSFCLFNFWQVSKGPRILPVPSVCGCMCIIVFCFCDKKSLLILMGLVTLICWTAYPWLRYGITHHIVM